MNDIAFLSEIDKEASLQENTILKRAEDSRAKILEEARKEVDRLEQALTHRTDLEIRKHQSRLLTQQDLEKRRDLLNLKTEFVTKALEAAREAFDGLSGEGYRDVLRKLLSELVASLDKNEKKVVLLVGPEDEKVAENLLKELRLSAELRMDPSVSRGAELEDEEGSFRMRNTFDSRLRQAHEEVIQCLNKVLFQ